MLFSAQPETADYIARVQATGGSLSAATVQAVDKFVLRGKTDSWWPLMSIIGVTAGNTLTASQVQLKAAPGVTPIFVNFTADDYKEKIGIDPGGSNSTKYVDLNVTLAALGLSATSLSAAVWASYNATTDFRETQNLTEYGAMIADYPSVGNTTFGLQINQAGAELGTRSTGGHEANGVTLISVSTSGMVLWTNGVIYGGLVPATYSTSTTAGTINLLRCKLNDSTYTSSIPISFYSVGQALTTSVAVSFSNAITTLMRDLGRIPNLPNVMVLGDSISEGANASYPTESWPNKVARQMGFNQINVSRSGDQWLAANGNSPPLNAPGMVNKIADILTAAPNLVIIMAGTNDERGDTNTLGNPVTVASYQSTLITNINTLIKNNIGVVLVAPPFNTDISAVKAQAYNLAARTAAASTSISYVDAYNVMLAATASASTLLSDSVHPNTAGHAVIAAAVVQQLRQTSIGGSFSLSAGAATVTDPFSTSGSQVIFRLKTVGGTITTPPVATVFTGSFSVAAGVADTSTYSYEIKRSQPLP